MEKSQNLTDAKLSKISVVRADEYYSWIRGRILNPQTVDPPEKSTAGHKYTCLVVIYLFKACHNVQESKSILCKAGMWKRRCVHILVYKYMYALTIVNNRKHISSSNIIYSRQYTHVDCIHMYLCKILYLQSLPFHTRTSSVVSMHKYSSEALVQSQREACRAWISVMVMTIMIVI